MVVYALHLVFATVQPGGLETTVDKPSVTHLVKAEVIVYCLIAADVLLVGRGLAVKEVPTYIYYCSLIHVYLFLVVYYVCSCV